MEYRTLGHSGVKVSTVCLGAMTFGEFDEKSMMYKAGCDEQTAFAIMDRALDMGVNLIDTADVYGQDGISERIVGNWFTSRKRRNEVVLATKFRFRMGPGPNGTGASRYRILRTVEDSLRRLQTDRIDLYQIHMQDSETPEEETLRALDDLVRQGKVLYLGCSNYAAYRLMESLWISRTQTLERFVTMQMQYSLVVRDIEREHVPLARRYGVGILPWSPLAGGLLSGKYQRNQPPPAGTRMDQKRWRDRLAAFDNERNWRIVDAVQAIASARGVTPSQVALAWCIAKPQVTSVIFGARSVEQLEDNVKAADLKLSEEEMKRLDEASAFKLDYPYEFMRQIQGTW